MLVDHLEFEHLRATPRTGRTVQVVFAANSGTDRIGLRHAPTGTRQGLRKTAADLTHLFGCPRRSPTAYVLQRCQTVLVRLGNPDQITRHRGRRDHRRQTLLIDQLRSLLRIPAVHTDHPTLQTVTCQVGCVQSGDMKERHRQQRTGLLGGDGGFDARNTFSNQPIEFPGQQGRDDVALG